MSNLLKRHKLELACVTIIAFLLIGWVTFFTLCANNDQLKNNFQQEVIQRKTAFTNAGRVKEEALSRLKIINEAIEYGRQEVLIHCECACPDPLPWSETTP